MVGIEDLKDQIRIELLGGVAFYLAGERVTTFRTRKAEAMMIYLVCNSGSHEREFLANLLWGELSQQRAKANVRLTLNNLRNIFGDIFDVTRYSIGLYYDVRFWLDVTFLDKLELDQATDISRLESITSLYRGNFLQSFYLEDTQDFTLWQTTQTEHWHLRIVATLHRLVDLYTWQGQYIAAIEQCKRLLQLDELDERCHFKLIRLLARNGNRAGALQHYDRSKELLWDELGIQPSQELQQLSKKISELDDERPHNLPGIATNISVGRHAELARLKMYLTEPNTRLISLLGLGGIGKTHLALRLGWFVAEDYFGPFIDGVYFVSLNTDPPDNNVATINTSTLINEISTSLSLPPSRTQAPRIQLLDFLSSRELLITIDNGEYLDQDALHFLSQMLAVAPALQILVTSRHALNLDDETQLRLQGLSFPQFTTPIVGKQRLDDQDLTLDAIQMFMTIANQYDQSISIDNLQSTSKEALLMIASLVEGLPLAIKLAAAWVTVLSLPEIAEKIRESIQLLKAQMPQIDKRHHSIRAVFEQSWAMLSETQQEDLKAIAVFAGSFNLEASEAITGVDAFSLSHLLSQSLVDSLIYHDSKRFKMHNLLRQFVSTKPFPQYDQTLLRLSDYYSKLLQSVQTQFEGPQMQYVTQLIEVNFANIRQGWTFAAKYERTLLEGYIPILYLFFMFRGWLEDGLSWFEYAYAQFPNTEIQIVNQPISDTVILSKLLPRIASLHYFTNNVSQALEILEVSKQAAHVLEEPLELILTYKRMGDFLFRRGDYEQGLTYLKFALEVAQAGELPNSEAHTLLHFGLIYQHLGNYDEAIKSLDKSIEIYRKVGFDWGVMNGLRLRADLSLSKPPHVPEILAESLSIAQRLEDRRAEAFVLIVQARFLMIQGNSTKVEAILAKALKLFKDAYYPHGVALTQIQYAKWASIAGEFRTACENLLDALAFAKQKKDMLLTVSIIQVTSEIICTLEDHKRAKNLLTLLKSNHLSDIRRSELLQIFHKLVDIEATDISNLSKSQMTVEHLQSQINELLNSLNDELMLGGNTNGR